MMGLRRIGRITICQGEIVDLCSDTVVLPDGKVEDWDFVHHKKGGGAAIVAVRKSDSRILLVRQFRPAIGETILELPAGGRDGTEDTMVTAYRELQEETGYAAEEGSMIKLCHILTAVAWCDEFTDIYLAPSVSKVSSQQLDEAEDINVEAFDLGDILQMIQEGTIEDAKTVAVICAYAAGKGTRS